MVGNEEFSWWSNVLEKEATFFNRLGQTHPHKAGALSPQKLGILRFKARSYWKQATLLARETTKAGSSPGGCQ